MIRAALVSLALLVPGCHGCGQKRAAAPDAAQATAAVARDAAPEARVARSRVFFTRHGDDLLPFGCFDAAKGPLLPGAECLALVAAQPTVEVPLAAGGSKVFSVERKRLKFDASGAEPEGFRLKISCTVDPGERQDYACEKEVAGFGAFAVWPAGDLSWVRLLPAVDRIGPLDARPPGDPVPPAVATEIDGLLAEAKARLLAPVALNAPLDVDLDGDGAVERILVADVHAEYVAPDGGPGDDETPYDGFHFMYLSRGDRYARMALSPPNDVDDVSDGIVLAVLDLDDDGAAELWLEHHYYEGHEHLIAQWRAGSWTIIDQFGDGT